MKPCGVCGGSFRPGNGGVVGEIWFCTDACMREGVARLRRIRTFLHNGNGADDITWDDVDWIWKHPEAIVLVPLEER